MCLYAIRLLLPAVVLLTVTPPGVDAYFSFHCGRSYREKPVIRPYRLVTHSEPASNALMLRLLNENAETGQTYDSSQLCRGHRVAGVMLIHKRA